MKIETTTNYSKFKNLKANRSVNKSHVQKLINSIEEFGYIVDKPISINENGEVIDGQHRLEALKALGLPVSYVVINGANEQTALTLNINNKPWTMYDYLKYHAERGIKSYQDVAELRHEYPSYALGSLIKIITGHVTNNQSNKFKAGEFKIEDYDGAINRLQHLDALNELKPVFMLQSSVGAYLYAIQHPEFDQDVFYEAMKSKGGLFTLYMRQTDNLREIEFVYNKFSDKKVRLM